MIYTSCIKLEACEKMKWDSSTPVASGSSFRTETIFLIVGTHTTDFLISFIQEFGSRGMRDNIGTGLRLSCAIQHGKTLVSVLQTFTFHYGTSFYSGNNSILHEPTTVPPQIMSSVYLPPLTRSTSSKWQTKPPEVSRCIASVTGVTFESP